MTAHAVIGGAGFLGRHLVRWLEATGDTVTVVDTSAYPGALSSSSRALRVDLVSASDRDFDEMIDGSDIVHHYAWTTLPASANLDPMADLRDNLRITLGLLDAIRRRGTGRMVFASSGGTVYGKLTRIPVPEDHPLAPITAYGVSKVAAENYLRLYRHLHGVDTRVVRIANPYGAGQDPTRQQGAVSTFVHRALQGQAIEIWGDGSTARDYIHIADVVPALAAVARLPYDPAQPMPIFNIGSGQHHTLSQVVAAIEGVLKTPVTVIRKAHRSFDVPVSVLDIANAGRELRWTPSIDLRSGVLRMVSDLAEDRLTKFSSQMAL